MRRQTVTSPLGRLALEGALCAAGFTAVTWPLLAWYRAAGAGGKLGIAIVVAGGYAGVYAAAVRWVEARQVSELTARNAPQALVGLALGASLVTITVGCVAALGGYRVVAIAPMAGLVGRIGPSLHAAVWEELVFRGLLFRSLEQWTGTTRALALSAMVFGGMHTAVDHGSFASGLAVALEAGVLLAVAFTATRTLWLPIGMHFGWNLTLGGVFGSAVSGTAVPAVLVSAIDGPTWLTGGPFGLEASVPAVVVCLAATTAFWRYGQIASREGCR